MISPTAAQAPHSAPQFLHDEFDAINWPQRTEGQKGMIVKTRMATYLPRLRVGASSEVTARAVSSLMPAPAPAMAIPATDTSVPMPYAIFREGALTDKDVHAVRG